MKQRVPRRAVPPAHRRQPVHLEAFARHRADATPGGSAAGSRSRAASPAPGDAERIGTDDAAQINVWVTVRAAGGLQHFSWNLRAPIVVRNGRGHQVINEAPEAPVRAALFPGADAAQAA